MSSTRRRTLRWGSAVVAAATMSIVAVAPANAGQGLPVHRKGHAWAPISTCEPAGPPPYTYTIRMQPLSSVQGDGKAYIAYANRTFKYYRGWRKATITVTDAPARPTEAGGMHYAPGHNNDPVRAVVVKGPPCR